MNKFQHVKYGTLTTMEDVTNVFQVRSRVGPESDFSTGKTAFYTSDDVRPIRDRLQWKNWSTLIHPLYEVRTKTVLHLNFTDGSTCLSPLHSNKQQLLF
jgi:hypothetical protein